MDERRLLSKRALQDFSVNRAYMTMPPSTVSTWPVT